MGRQFKEQFVWLGHVWDSWTEAEKVIASYSVLQKLSPVSTRFILSLLRENTQNDDPDLSSAEARANDPAWVSHIQDGGDGGTSELLQHLPLLRTSNVEAKSQYLTVIPKVLAQTLSQPVVHDVTLEKARQLLSYSLVHPAISVEEKKALGPWIKSFEDRLSQAKHNEGFESSCDPGDEEADDESTEADRTNYEGKEKLSMLDLKEGSLRISSSSDEKSSKWNGSHKSDPCLKDFHRWSYLENSLSPNHSGTSSRSPGSESVSDEAHTSNYHPGMKDISVWLKSLRLHKYDPLLSSLTYDELMSLTEENLEAKGVTQGARNKILMSIAKLRTRHEQLNTIEEELMSSGNVQPALNQLKSLILTPMLPHHKDVEDSESSQTLQNPDKAMLASQSVDQTGALDDLDDCDLPARFTRVMGKVCTQLLVGLRPENESVSLFLQLVEKSQYHEAFTINLKRKMLTWKEQVQTTCHPVPTRTKDGRHVRRWSHQFSGDLTNASSRSNRLTSQRYSTPSTPQMANILAGNIPGKGPSHPFIPPHMGFYSIQPSLSAMIAPRTSLPIPGTASTTLLSPQHFFAKRPSLQETTSDLRPHVTLQRTRSAPSRPNQVLSLSQARAGAAKVGDRSGMQVRNGPGPTKGPELQSLQEGSSHYVTPDVIDPDITNRLESLCLSMTEHALG